MTNRKAPTIDALAMLMTSVVPDDARFAVADVAPHHIDTLPLDERNLSCTWRDTRRQEFAAGRACARDTLRRLGASTDKIGRDDRGAPLAPPRFSLSISHTRSLAVAIAIDDANGRRSAGIDIEEEGRIGPTLWHLVASPSEIAMARRHRPTDTAAAALIFSAKESAFKAAYSRIDRILGFDQMTVQILSDSTFVARLLIQEPQPTTPIAGRFAALEGLIITTATMEV